MQKTDWWTEAEDAARHALTFRVRDPARRDDLVQETLVRLATVQDRLDEDAVVPYAIVTARNLAVSAYRKDGRVNCFDVVDMCEGSTAPGADDEVVRLEEAEALHTALAQLPPSDRSLIVDRDLHGVGISELARRHETTEGATRARLTRLRGRLRVEYVLALRQIRELPSPWCRPTLEALAAGDATKLRNGHVNAHVRSCSTCSALEPIVRHRKRWLAALLAALGLERLFALMKAHPAVSTAAGATTVAVASFGFAAIARDSSPPPRAAPAAVATATTTATTPTTVTTGPAPTVTTPPAPPAASSSQVVINGAPWPAQAATFGAPATATDLRVIDVTGDETFMAATNDGSRVAVHLTGVAESPFLIQPGQVVAFAGTAGSVDQTLDDGTRAVVINVAYDQITIVR